MVGTILNVITVAIGSALGLIIGDRLPKNTQTSVITGLGLVTLVVGISNAMLSGNIIIPLISLIVGVMIGEWVNIQKGLDELGGWLQAWIAKRTTADSATTETDTASARERFINGFVTASLVFCIGPLTFVGSIQDGISGNYELLAIKAVLDGFAALAFAASLGVGVSFSIITIIILQGSLALLGRLAGEVMTEAMINEMSSAGGIMLIGLSLILLDIKQPRMANYLPALFIAPLIVAIGRWLGIDVYPNF